MNQKGYFCFDPHTNRIHVSRNVIFLENQCFFPILSSATPTTHAMLPSVTDFDPTSQHDPLNTPTIKNITQESSICQPLLVYRCRRPPVQPPSPTVLSSDSRHPTDSEVPNSPPTLPPLRRTARISIPLDRYGFQSSKTTSSQSALSATLHSTAIPTSYSQAAAESCWQQAMQEELHALKSNHLGYGGLP